MATTPTTTTTTTIATPTPATPGGILTDYGQAVGVRPTYYAGQAPAVVMLDASAVAAMDDERAWNFGDGADPRTDFRHVARPDLYTAATIDGNSGLRSPQAVHEYANPGTYTATLTVTPQAGGPPVTYSQTIAVGANTRKTFYFGPAGSDANAGTDPSAPLKSAAKLVALAGSAGLTDVYVVLLPGWTDTLPGSIHLGGDAILEGRPAADGSLPVILTGAFPAFVCDVNRTVGSSVRFVRIASADRPSPKYAAPVRKGVDGSVGLSGRGTNVALVGVEFGYLDRAVELWQGDGYAAIGCRTLDPTSMYSQAWSQWEGITTDATGRVTGGRAACHFCDWQGCTDEITARTDGPASGYGVSFDACRIGQATAQNGKALFCSRNGHGFYVGQSCLVGAQATATSTIGSTDTYTRGLLMTDNLLVSADIEGQPRTDGWTIRRNHIVPAQAADPHVTLTPLPDVGPLQNVKVYENTTDSGGPIRVKVDAGTVPGLTTDAGVGIAWVTVATPAATPPAFTPPAAPPAASVTPPGPLTGTPIGTAGSYQGDGNTIGKAFDGDNATFVDGPGPDGGWVGLDLGQPRTITGVSYVARKQYESRMEGGHFEASGTLDFAAAVRLASVPGRPESGQTVTLAVTPPAGPYRFVRYVSPAGSFDNIATLVFEGY